MQKINYSIFKWVLILCVYCPALVSGQSTTGKASDTRNQSSHLSEMWAKGGSFEDFSPSQEVVERRTKNAKHFRNANGTFTVQTGGVYHYKDNNGKWQDISLAVVPATNKAGYSYGNESNEFKTWFPEKPGSNPVQMQLSNTISFNWWNSPSLNFIINGQVAQTISPNKVNGVLEKNEGNATVNKTISYPMIYNGISEEFVMLGNGVENNTILHSLTPQMNALPNNASLEFKQFIPFQNNWKIDVNGSVKNEQFNSTQFHISIPGTESGIYFSPVIVFDHTISREEAEYLAYAPAGKLTTQQQEQKQKHLYECDYSVNFIAGGVEVSTSLPAEWLKKNDRVFPVTIDPTVTITPPSSAGNFYGPMTNWYGYQRHADLYLGTEIGVSNIIISDIEYNRTSTSGTNASKPIKIYMNTTTATQLSGTAAWNSTTYTGGLTPLYDGSMDLFGTTTGWKMITLTVPYTYTGDNLLVMGYDAYAGGGSAKYLNQSNTSVTNRQAYKRQDNTDPGDATATAVESRLTEIRLTYTNASTCSGTPTAGTIVGPTAVCANVSFTLSLSGATQAGGLTYQWEYSPVGAGSFQPIAGATNQSYTTTMTADSDYHCVVTCSVGGSSSTTNTQTVTMNPWYNCYCTPASNCTNEGIENVTMGTLNNTSTFCTLATGYSNFGSLGSLTNVNQGTLVPISVTGHINSNPSSAGVWIDYDHNNTFDASEYTSLGSSPTQASLPATYVFNGTISIPATAMTGITRMRVRTANQGGITSGSACTNSGVYGEYEDYLITIDPGNMCTGAPVAGSVSGPTTACSGASFTLTASGFTTGVTGLSYEWQVWNPSTTTWDPAPGTNNAVSYTASSGITANTDFRFVITCTNGGGTDNAMYTVSLAPVTQCYCIPTYTTNNAVDIITNIQLGSLTNASGQSTIVPNYSDYTPLQPSSLAIPDLAQGLSYNLSVTFGTDGTQYHRVWIDFDQNGVFDPSESFVGTPLPAGGSATATVPIAIPATALLGNTRMRIRGGDDAAISDNQPCGASNSGYGEGEDYLVNITTPPTCAPPSGLAATNITSATADINWNAVTGAVGYEYVINQTAANPSGSGTSINGTTYSASGLGGAGATYYFHLRTDCGGGDFSSWSVFSFVTAVDNDNYCGATNLIVNDPTVSWVNTTAATTDATDPTNINGCTTPNNNVWYKFTTNLAGIYNINSFAPPTGTNNMSAWMWLYTASGTCPGTLTFTNVADLTNCATAVPAASPVAAGATSTTATPALTAGTTYYFFVDGNSGSFGNIGFTVSYSPLAIKLTDINAVNEGRNNIINWSTASEDKTDKFELERSQDGRVYGKIYSTNANGIASNYAYTDVDAPAGISYYRLKMKDAAGKEQYSKVVSAVVKVNGSFTVEAFPNPVTNVLNIRVHGAMGDNASVTISDVTGKLISTQMVTGDDTHVNMNGMANGVYLIKYTDSNHNQTIKVNKQ